MKISYVTTYDALDIHSWSGTGYMIAKALENQDNQIQYIGDLNSRPSLMMHLKKAYHKLMGRNFAFDRDPFLARRYASQIKPLLAPDSDIIFSPGTVPISLLETKQPKVFYTDATFAGMLGFYKYYSNFSKETVQNGNFLEQKALDSSKMAIYSSDWAAQSAIDNYNVNPNKIKVVPFGSNVESTRDLKSVNEIIKARFSSKECHLLFPAVEWDRKGGDMAVKIAAKLNELGLTTILHIVGIKNSKHYAFPDFVRNHGFISKADERGKEKIASLFTNSHFLILPALADCTPIVFSEANSFGLPCISSDVGGIKSIIRDNVNGKTFPLSTHEDVYSNYLLSTFTDREFYKQLALSSFAEYESRLNWKVSGKIITGLLRDL